MFSNSITSPTYQGWGALCCGDFNLLLLTSVEDWLLVPDVTSSTDTMEMLGQFFVLKRKRPSTQVFSFTFIYLSISPSIHPSKHYYPCKPVVWAHCQFSFFLKLVPSLFVFVSCSLLHLVHSSVTDFHNPQNRTGLSEKSSILKRVSEFPQDLILVTVSL